jgi:hypothetical protein
MSRNTSSNTGAAGCGYLIALVAIGWVVVVMLPYILMGAAACFIVWLLVRFHREAWMVLQWVGDLLVWITVAVFMAARWLVFHACAWINRRCQIPVLPASATRSKPAPPPNPQPPPSIAAPPPSGWKLKPRVGPP